MWDLSISYLWYQGRPTLRLNIAVNHNVSYHVNARMTAVCTAGHNDGDRFISFSHLHTLSKIFTPFESFTAP